jgi:hypothetical protein
MNGPVRREGEGGVDAEVEEEVREEEAHHGRAPEDLAVGGHQLRKSATKPRKSAAKPRKSAAKPGKSAARPRRQVLALPHYEVQALMFDLLLRQINFAVLLLLL